MSLYDGTHSPEGQLAQQAPSAKDRAHKRVALAHALRQRGYIRAPDTQPQTRHRGGVS